MGTASRTDRNSLITKAKVIDLFYSSATTFLDYGAGYGMFVRRMRDLGYNFYAYDLHCPNMFAEQVALADLEGKHFDLTTAFEVFEHLVDPLTVAKILFKLTDHLLLTTEVVRLTRYRPWRHGGTGCSRTRATYQFFYAEGVARFSG